MGSSLCILLLYFRTENERGPAIARGLLRLDYKRSQFMKNKIIYFVKIGGEIFIFIFVIVVLYFETLDI